MPDAGNNQNNDLPDFLTPNEIKFINKYKEYVSKHKLKEPDDKFLKEAKAKVEAVTQEQIDNLRTQILEYIEKNKETKKIAERFIKELTLDNYLRGYIAREHKDPVEKVVAAMEYLSTTDGITDETFPKEFLEFGVNAASGFDVYGNPVFYLFAKRNFVPKKLFEKTEKYAAYVIYQLVRVSLFTNGFFTMLLDFSGAGVANVDFNALRLLITILNDHAPACLNRVICYNVHWSLRPAFKLGYALLPSNVGDMMHTASGKDINKFIANDQLLSMIEGGENAEIVLGRPKKTSLSFLDVSDKVNLAKDEAQKLIDQFKKALNKHKIELLAYE